MKELTMFEQFSKGIGDAIDDIRAHYEEAVFGRSLTDQGGEVAAPQTDELRPGFGSHTHHIEPGYPGDEWPKAHSVQGEILEPEREPQPGRPSDCLLEHGEVINQKPAEWPQARETDPSHRLEDRSRDIDQGIDR